MRNRAGRIVQLVTFAGLCMLIGFSLMTTIPNENAGDVGVFIGAGRLAAQGQNPYEASTITPHRADGVPYVTLSPPITVMAFQAVAWSDPLAVLRASYPINLAVYSLLVGILWLTNRKRLTAVQITWALAIFPFWVTVALGQVHVVLLGLVVAAWFALRARRDVLAGLILALLVAWKPNLGIWPLLLVLAAHRKAGIWAIFGATLLSIWPALVDGPATYVQWIRASSQTTAGLGGWGVLSWVGGLVGLGWLALPVAILVLSGTIAWVRVRQPPIDQLNAVALIVALLALPITGGDYLLLLLPIFFLRRWSRLTILAAACLLMPWPLAYTAMSFVPCLIALVALGIDVIRVCSFAGEPSPVAVSGAVVSERLAAPTNSLLPTPHKDVLDAALKDARPTAVREQ